MRREPRSLDHSFLLPNTSAIRAQSAALSCGRTPWGWTHLDVRQGSSPSYRRVPSVHSNRRCSTTCEPCPTAPAGPFEAPTFRPGNLCGRLQSRRSCPLELMDYQQLESAVRSEKMYAGRSEEPLAGYSKRHSITTIYHASRRHAADAAQSRNPSCEVAGATPPLPGRQGVRGSNPRCSTET